MARKSVVVRNEKRWVKVQRNLDKRAVLKKRVIDENLSWEERYEAVQRLSTIGRDTATVRYNRRCKLCGRPKGVYRRFQLCRLCLRKFAMKGEVPGITAASW